MRMAKRPHAATRRAWAVAGDEPEVPVCGAVSTSVAATAACCLMNIVHALVIVASQPASVCRFASGARSVTDHRVRHDDLERGLRRLVGRERVLARARRVREAAHGTSPARASRAAPRARRRRPIWLLLGRGVESRRVPSRLGGGTGLAQAGSARASRSAWGVRHRRHGVGIGLAAPYGEHGVAVVASSNCRQRATARESAQIGQPGLRYFVRVGPHAPGTAGLYTLGTACRNSTTCDTVNSQLKNCPWYHCARWMGYSTRNRGVNFTNQNQKLITSE